MVTDIQGQKCDWKKMKKTQSVRLWYGHWRTGSKTWLKKKWPILSDSGMVTGRVNIILYWNGKVDSILGSTLPKLLNISENSSNKSCWALNFVQKSQWKRLAPFLVENELGGLCMSPNPHKPTFSFLAVIVHKRKKCVYKHTQTNDQFFVLIGFVVGILRHGPTVKKVADISYKDSDTY